MKCEHLIKVTVSASIKGQIVNSIGHYRDMVVCGGDVNTCPKKKQPCEINRRCWEMKK